MEGIRVFLAASLHTNDSAVRSHFLEMLKSQGFDVQTVDGASLEDTGERVKKAVEACPVVALLVTKRGGSRGPTWVDFEGGLAFGNKKIIMAFVERGVKDTGPYKAALRGTYLEFERSNLSGTIPGIVKLCEEVKQVLKAPRPDVHITDLPTDFADPHYHTTLMEKDIWICPSGHGAISYKLEIEANTTVDHVPHRVGLNDFVPQKVKLPLLSRMKDPRRNIWTSATLRVGLISGPHRLFVLRPEYDTIEPELAQDGDRPGRVRFFRLGFPSPLTKGDRLTYSWVWSFPGLFRAAHEAGKDGSMYRTEHGLDVLRFGLNFFAVDDWPVFDRSPSLEIEDPFGMRVAVPPSLRSADAFRMRFEWQHQGMKARSRCQLAWSFPRRRGRASA